MAIIRMSEIEKLLCKSIEETAQDMARKVYIRWEELCVESATTEQLLKAQEFIQKELKKRANKEF